MRLTWEMTRASKICLRVYARAVSVRTKDTHSVTRKVTEKENRAREREREREREKEGDERSTVTQFLARGCDVRLPHRSVTRRILA